MSEPTSGVGGPRVTIETDAGPVELSFGYAPVGDPAFADMPGQGPWLDTEAEAEQYGAMVVGFGNWRSFTVEKRYFRVHDSDDPEVPRG